MSTRQQKILSPQLVAKVARFIFNGFDDDEISCLVNLPVSKVKSLRAGKDDPRVRFQTLVLKDAVIERIKKGRGKLSGLMWFLERRYPRQYARADVQLSLSAGPVTNNTLVVSAEVASQLMARSKSTLSEIDQLIADKEPAEQTE